MKKARVCSPWGWGVSGWGLADTDDTTNSQDCRAHRDRLARGKYKYLINLADCDGCHSERDFSRFDAPLVAGRRGVGMCSPRRWDYPTWLLPISRDPKTGIRAWTDSEKIRAIREGVDKDGRAPFPIMPYENFRHMSDDDVLSRVAYLETCAATGAQRRGS